MSLFISSLNSGSNGNCYYIANHDVAILVDGGISCRETERRMKRLELSMKKVKAIFVSHEHADHIYGVTRLSKKYQLPVYITAQTQSGGNLHINQSLSMPFKAYEPVSFGNLTVTAFPKFHDATDPHSFIVSSESVSVGIFTDIGRTCSHVIKHFEQCDAAFLESNYDEHLLDTGTYPYALKRRIKDGNGHLSNVQAAELFLNHRPSFMSHLFLSHLSKHNNSPKIVRKLFEGIAGPTQIIIAPRDKETRVYHIRHKPGLYGNNVIKNAPKPVQLSLFQ